MGKLFYYGRTMYEFSDDPKVAKKQLQDFRKYRLEEDKKTPLLDSPAVVNQEITGNPGDYRKQGYIYDTKEGSYQFKLLNKENFDYRKKFNLIIIKCRSVRNIDYIVS